MFRSGQSRKRLQGYIIAREGRIPGKTDFSGIVYNPVSELPGASDIKAYI